MKKPETLGDDRKTINFHDLFDRSNGDNAIFKAAFTPQANGSLEQLPTLQIGDWLSTGDPDTALDAADKTIQEIKDASKLSGAERDVALNKIVQEIQDRSKQPDFNFHMYYVGFQMDLSQDGDKEAVMALAKLDPLYRIGDALEKAFLPNAVKLNDIHNSVDTHIGEILLTDQNNPAPAAFESIAESIQKDLSSLTRDEQEVYLFSLAYQLGSLPGIKERLNNPRTKDGISLLMGGFFVTPTDAGP